MSVEVLIVSFNTRDLLRDCLASVARFGGCPVAVFDNASTDGSAEMVAAQFPAARLVRGTENIGFARANDRLARSSVATHLLLLNSDTVWTEDLAAPMLAMLESDPAIALVGPRLVGADGEPQFSSEGFPDLRFELARALRGTKLAPRGAEARLDRARHVDDVRARRTHDTDFLWATCWLVRRADVSDGVFDEHFVTYDEDLDLCRRLRADGRRIVWLGSVSLVHLGGASSAPRAKRVLERRGRTRYYRRHAGRATALAHAAIVRASDGARALTALTR